MSTSAPIGILTAGAWGTALAQTLAMAGHTVLVWDRDDTVVNDINQRHENRKRYPGIVLHDKVMATGDIASIPQHCDIIIVAAPSDANVSLAAQLSKSIAQHHILVLASKGFRESDGSLLENVWREACPALVDTNICVLTGPTFAREMMESKVTACVVAGRISAVVTRIMALFTTPYMRPYASTDVIGTQVGGAMKNIMAIAAGILDGLELGYNARAAMLSRGLAEMARYAKLMGGNEQTIWGLAGMGDVMLTATSTFSRNYRFGQMVGRGTPVHEAKLKIGTVEGILAARIVTVQAQAHGMDLAIVSAIDGILHGDVTPLRVVDYLMKRPVTEEFPA